MRWIMCPKCGVKLIKKESDESVIISKCPVCKRYYLTIKPKSELLSWLNIVSEERGMSIKELLLEGIDNYLSIARKTYGMYGIE